MDVGRKQTAISKMMESIKSLPCWNVTCGDSAGASFELFFGKKIKRRVPRFVAKRIVDQNQDYGEANLLVWCDWRLDNATAPVTSSDDTQLKMQRGLARLVGASVEAAHVRAPAWDLTLEFSNQLVLRVFCDHVPGDPSLEGNWELFMVEKSLHVGPGSKFRIEKVHGPRELQARRTADSHRE